jgi:nitric oxide reductase subunit B
MVVLDLFPAGLLQLWAVLEHGLWYGRSPEFIQGTTFQTLTWLRAVGGPIFVVGGLLPLAWFTLSRYRMLKPASAPLASPALPTPVEPPAKAGAPT